MRGEFLSAFIHLTLINPSSNPNLSLLIVRAPTFLDNFLKTFRGVKEKFAIFWDSFIETAGKNKQNSRYLQ